LKNAIEGFTIFVYICASLNLEQFRQEDEQKSCNVEAPELRDLRNPLRNCNGFFQG